MEKMEFIEIPLHGILGKGKTTIVDGDYDGEYFSQFIWYLAKNGYAMRQHYCEKTGKRKMIYLHHEVLNTSRARVGHVVRDHIDGNKLNNRSCNLRLIAHSENIRNKKSNSVE